MVGCASLLSIDAVDYASGDASALDAPTETAPPEAATGDSAEGDAADANRVDTGFACPDAGEPLPFCAAFDQDPLSRDWTKLDNGSDAAVFRWRDAAVSPPTSVMFTSSVVTASAVSLIRDFAVPTTPKSFSLDFDMWVENAAGDPTAEIVHLTFGTSKPFYQLQLVLYGNGAGLRVDLWDGAQKATPFQDKALSVSWRKWHHVHLEGRLAPPTATLSLDDLLANVTLEFDGGLTVVQLPPELGVGLPHLNLVASGNDYRVAFDDVLFDCR